MITTIILICYITTVAAITTTTTTIITTTTVISSFKIPLNQVYFAKTNTLSKGAIATNNTIYGNKCCYFYNYYENNTAIKPRKKPTSLTRKRKRNVPVSVNANQIRGE